MNRRVRHAATAVVVLCAPLPYGVRPGHAQCVLNETATCAPDDGYFISGFGEAVAISGDTAIVGAHADDEAGEYAGAAYFYRADGNSWVQQLKLIASDAHEGQSFGQAVALDGDLAVVGAPDTHTSFLRGAAHVYRFDGTTWNEEAILTPSDPLTGIQFGTSVAVEGDVVLVGRVLEAGLIGSVYVFRRTAGIWMEQQKLNPDVPIENGLFGTSVSLTGGDALIGANHRVGGDPTGPGAAYVFRFNGNVWLQAQMLTATVPADQDGFGTSVCTRGDRAIVGAYYGGADTPHVGSAYVFRKESGVWVQEDELVPSDGEVNDGFGSSVAIGGDTAVIGAPGDDEQGIGSGSAYLFRRAGSSWVEAAKLLGSNLEAYDGFGWAVGRDEDRALVGGWGTWPSLVYVYDGLDDADGDGVVDACECDWDLNGDSTVNVVDFLGLLAAWGTDPGGPPDFDGNGTVDIADFLQMLAHWGPCP
ncbi:MAG: FG-GAP repeat protein [Planctomycetota bacterium]|jgi:hypothetical protein